MNFKYRMFLAGLFVSVLAATSCPAVVQDDSGSGIWQPDDVTELLDEATDAQQAVDDGSETDASEAVPVADQPDLLPLVGIRFAEYFANQEQSENSGKDKLQKMIELVRSITFVRKPAAPEPGPVQVVPPSVAEPESVSPPQQAEQIEIGEPAPGPSHQPVSRETLSRLEALCREGEQVLNPAGVAETLFASGNIKEAAKFYQLALDQLSGDGPDVCHEDRAWMLFQIGNCLREYNTETATKTYRQLVSEYPNSQWTPIAAAYVNLIEWYQKDEPAKLISSTKPGNEKAKDE